MAIAFISTGFSQSRPHCDLGVVHAQITEDDGNETGRIELSIEQSSSTHTYIWSDGSTDTIRSGLTAGKYYVTVTDQRGCEKKMDFFVPGDDVGNLAVSELTFDLYTVPKDSRLKVNLQGNHVGKRIRIFNSEGKMVMMKTYARELNIDRLPSGLYYFELESAERATGRRKFIKS